MQNGYLYITVSLMAVALSSFVMYDEERMKASRFALGIISLSALVMPLISAVKGIESIKFSYTDNIYSSTALQETLETAFADGISNAIEDEFLIRDKDVDVRVVGFDEKEMRAEQIFVTLSGRAVAKDIRAVEKFVTELDLGKCVLEVHFG